MVCTGSDQRVPGQQYLANGEHGARQILRHLPAAARPRLHQRARHAHHRRADLPRSSRVQPAAVLALPRRRVAVRLAVRRDRHEYYCGRCSTRSAARLPLCILLQGATAHYVVYLVYWLRLAATLVYSLIISEIDYCNCNSLYGTVNLSTLLQTFKSKLGKTHLFNQLYRHGDTSHMYIWPTVYWFYIA